MRTAKRIQSAACSKSGFEPAQNSIWVIAICGLSNRPPIALPGAFKIWQHTATEESRRYVDEDWEIAFYRQGYKDYSKRFVDPDDYDEVRHLVYDTNIQLFFVKPLTDHARSVIDAMDLDELAKTNLSTLGFGKRDFVWWYLETERKLNGI